MLQARDCPRQCQRKLFAEQLLQRAPFRHVLLRRRTQSRTAQQRACKRLRPKAQAASSTGHGRGSEIVGSEYGEGFFQYRLSGEPLHLSVDLLNERLRVAGAERMRHATMRPDEAFGMVFTWDCLAPMREVQRAAWRRVARAEDLPLPAAERAQLYTLRPERAITEVLQWTRNWGEAQRLAWQVAEAYTAEFAAVMEPMRGVRTWLRALANAGVPCALVSTFDRRSVVEAVERMGLGEWFRPGMLVTAEDGMETVSQSFLSAAIKLGRPPDHCVVFDALPTGVTAAHNCTMKAVALVGTHPGYQLQQADLTCSSLTELSIVNIRRLFADRGHAFMDRSKQVAAGGPRVRRWTASGTIDP